MKIKTKDLTGAALDWAVAVALGNQPLVIPMGRVKYAVGVTVVGEDGKVTGFACRYSTDWAQGGPLLAELMASAQYAITPFLNGGFAISNTDNEGFAYNNDSYQGCFEVIGDDLLMVTCRAVVASRLGQEIEIPDKLMEAA